MVPFMKASACRNEFLLIESAHAPGKLAEFTRAICDRHQGVGADGVEWLSPPAAGADVDVRLINADGSEAEISGNGTRCVAAYLRSTGQPQSSFAIRTGAGVKTCVLVSQSGQRYEFETAMGEPRVGAKLRLTLQSQTVTGTLVSTGNPHIVVFVEVFPDGWRETAAEIQRQPDFPQGVNVEFVKIVDHSNIRVRLFERGAGETQSSGTGSCASAVAAIAAGRVESPVQVHAPGGAQTVRWERGLFLRGAAQLICRGEFFV